MKKQLLFITFLSLSSLRADLNTKRNIFLPLINNQLGRTIVCALVATVPALLFWNRRIDSEYSTIHQNSTFLRRCWSELNVCANKAMGGRTTSDKPKLCLKDILSLLGVMGCIATSMALCQVN